VSEERIVVVGIGADGYAGLGEPARRALQAAKEIVGSRRQLSLLPPQLQAKGTAWPSPITPLLDRLCTEEREGVCVLASGNPMLYGIGATLARRLGPKALLVYPHPSTVAFVCARLGWPQQEVGCVNLLAQPVSSAASLFGPAARFVALVSGREQAAALGQLLLDHGLEAAETFLCVELGGSGERIEPLRPAQLAAAPTAAELFAVAVACPPDGPYPHRAAGLPEHHFSHDGQITKWPVRAITVAALAPQPGLLLWDVGAGSGSVGLEWLRLAGRGRVVAVEQNPSRAARIAENAARFGLLGVEVVEGQAPEALASLPEPDRIFVGGGLDQEGLLAFCIERLKEGGILVANATTLEGEGVLSAYQRRFGGELLRIELADAAPLGRFRSYHPRHPILQWKVCR
jgi:precorrin-6Y C5,15-methyltransferase (decarboxylating)